MLRFPILTAAFVCAATLGTTPALAEPGQAVEPPAVVAPMVDHHLHLPGPALIEVLTPTAEKPVTTIPAELARLLERRELRGPPSLKLVRELYTSDAVIRSRRGASWVSGPVNVARALSEYQPGYRLLPVSYSITGNTGYVVGYFARGEQYNATFELALKREHDGWRIAVDNIIPEPPVMTPPRLSADELIFELDKAGARFGVIHSVAFWPGSPLFIGEGDEEAAVRAENDWTSQQVSRYADRLVGFCGVNPLKEYAVREIQRCAQLAGMRGIKLHFGNSNISVRDPEHLQRVKAMFAAGNSLRLPIAVHMEEIKDYGAEQAEIFLSELLPLTAGIPVQVMHMAGAGPGYSRDAAFEVLARARELGDPRVRDLYVDVASNAVASTPPENLELMAKRLRQFGLDHVLFGSDRVPGVTNEDPAAAWASFRRLPLEPDEFQIVARNAAPWIRAQ